jgi:hypothetical protein
MGKFTLLNLGALSNLAGTSLIAIAATVFYVGSNGKAPATPQAPVYSQIVHNEAMGTDEICFRDNRAVGMSARIHYQGRTPPMKPKANGFDYQFFEFPRDATKYDGELEIIATDCDGNCSTPETFYSFGGAIYKNKPAGWDERFKAPSSQPSTSQPSTSQSSNEDIAN